MVISSRTQESSMKKVNDKYRGSAQYFMVFNELASAARHRGTTTYQELADLIGLPIVGAYMGKEIGHLLGEISEDEVDRNRPMLSAIAVGVDGSPGDGFFNLAKSLGKLASDGREEKNGFWEEEKKKVYDMWKRKFG
jgi:hypothetical protein